MSALLAFLAERPEEVAMVATFLLGLLNAVIPASDHPLRRALDRMATTTMPGDPQSLKLPGRKSIAPEE